MNAKQAETEQQPDLSRRSFLRMAAVSSASLLAANLATYAVGSAFKKLDGSLVAGAKTYACSCSYDGSNGGTAWGSCGVCPPCDATGPEMFMQDMDGNCAPSPGFTCGHMYQTCQP